MTLLVRPDLDDAELSALHGAAFGTSYRLEPWTERLRSASLTWVAAFADGALVGFVNVVGDGGRHAFLLDTAVAPDFRGRGVGSDLVRTAAAQARALGCEWLHVDYEPHLEGFYRDAVGFVPTPAAVLRLID